MEQKFLEELVSEVRSDFDRRRDERRPIELAWRLNMSFLVGNQYSEITARGDVEDFGKQFYWQEREVFNHIAPIIETRLAKLARVRSGVSVRPATTDEADLAAAKFSTSVLNSITAENNLPSLLLEATASTAAITAKLGRLETEARCLTACLSSIGR